MGIMDMFRPGGASNENTPKAEMEVVKSPSDTKLEELDGEMREYFDEKLPKDDNAYESKVSFEDLEKELPEEDINKAA
jgi:hypothetical protein